MRKARKSVPTAVAANKGALLPGSVLPANLSTHWKKKRASAMTPSCPHANRMKAPVFMGAEHRRSSLVGDPGPRKELPRLHGRQPRKELTRRRFDRRGRQPRLKEAKHTFRRLPVRVAIGPERSWSQQAVCHALSCAAPAQVTASSRSALCQSVPARGRAVVALLALEQPALLRPKQGRDVDGVGDLAGLEIGRASCRERG